MMATHDKPEPQVSLNHLKVLCADFEYYLSLWYMDTCSIFSSDITKETLLTCLIQYFNGL